MKNVILVAVAVLFSLQAFADDSVILQPRESKCLNKGARAIVSMLSEAGYSYQVVYSKSRLAQSLQPLEEGEPTYTLGEIVRNGDLEEFYFTSDFDSASVYSVMQVLPNGQCEEHAVGEAQDDGD